jgi:hypothetical protein
MKITRTSRDDGSVSAVTLESALEKLTQATGQASAEITQALAAGQTLHTASFLYRRASQ